MASTGSSVLVSDAAALLNPRLGAPSPLNARTRLRPYSFDHLALIVRTADPSVLVATAA
ncbi:hypothetical protein [Streptomyces sp. NPDC002540]